MSVTFKLILSFSFTSLIKNQSAGGPPTSPAAGLAHNVRSTGPLDELSPDEQAVARRLNKSVARQSHMVSFRALGLAFMGFRSLVVQNHSTPLGKGERQGDTP